MLSFLLMLMTPYLTGTNPVLNDANQALQRVYASVVAADGTVDYPKLKRDQALQQDLERYLVFAKNLDLAQLKDQERIAVLGNCYNAFTLHGVTQAWPVASVRKIRALFGFFSKQTFPFAGSEITLNDLEGEYLRPLDPRIHFIINCASASCPQLMNKVMTAENVASLMEQATLSFLTDQQKNVFNADEWRLSKIFDWYEKDFGGKQGVVAFILKYRPELKAPTKLKYLPYDWALNGPTS